MFNKKEKYNGRIGVYIHPDGQSATMVEVFCDTDFLAKSSEFKGFVNNIAIESHYGNPYDSLLEWALDKFKENIVIGRVLSWK